MDEKMIRKIEGHLRGTFANARISLVPRPKQKDSAEVYVGEEFVGVVFEDEDDDGSFMFEMAILKTFPRAARARLVFYDCAFAT